MTYGWTIVIIAVALILLWQWGIFNPKGNIRQTYLGFWGITPIDVSYRTDGSLILVLQNNIVDGDINITQIIIREGSCATCPVYDSGALNPNHFVRAGTRYQLNVSAGSGLPGGSEGAPYELLVEIHYLDNRLNMSLYPDITDFQSSGTIQGSIEKT